MHLRLSKMNLPVICREDLQAFSLPPLHLPQNELSIFEVVLYKCYTKDVGLSWRSRFISFHMLRNSFWIMQASTISLFPPPISSNAYGTQFEPVSSTVKVLAKSIKPARKQNTNCYSTLWLPFWRLLAVYSNVCKQKKEIRSQTLGQHFARKSIRF